MNKRGHCAASCAALALCAAFCFSMPARAAVVIDGVAGAAEWFESTLITLVAPGEDSYCGIDSAFLRYFISDDGLSVMILFSGQAPGATDETDLGVSFRAGGREIATYRQSSGANCEIDNYHFEGAINVARRNDGVYNTDGDFYVELLLACKTSAAFAALESLVVRMYDPLGVPSKDISAPIRLPEPETTTTTQTTTTTRTTTTKTTTSRTTITGTATTKTTTAKTTTAKGTTATAAPGAAAPSAIVEPEPSHEPATQAQIVVDEDMPSTRRNANNASGGNALQTETQQNYAPQDAAEHAYTQPDETLWDYATQEQETEAEQNGTPDAPAAASMKTRGVVLVSAGVVLLTMSAGAVVLWLRANGLALKFRVKRKK